MSYRYKTGLVLGKFYPLTKGHQLLIDRAQSMCRNVTICISHRDEVIPATVRVGWLKTLYPKANIVLLPSHLPYYPPESPSEHEFYVIWRDALIAACSCVPEAVFSSEEYGSDVSRYLGCTVVDPHDAARYLPCDHICVDQARLIVPISGTLVRENPMESWQYLDPVVRAYFVKTVCVYGPESCGKTTLAGQLAEYYHTVWQHEFARPYLDAVARHCEYEDMLPIAEGHLRERGDFLKRAYKIMFTDTDTYTTMVYSEKYYGKYPPELDAIAADPSNQNDFYLLLRPDIPWMKDTTRDLGEVRQEMYERFKAKLDKYGKRYVEIGGFARERLNNAVAAVDNFMSSVTNGKTGGIGSNIMKP